jgi:hypothetical protein
MLEVVRITRTLCLTRPGRLWPWMGPALRGLLGGRLKEAVCRQPAELRDTRWRYCAGCPHLAGCAYGATLEPDPPAGAAVFAGQERAARPVVLALPFPLPPRAAPGLELPLAVTFIGPAAAHAEAVWRALAEAGADPAGGFGPDHVTFALAPARLVQRDVLDLPPAVTGRDWLPAVEVELTAPLFLRRRDGDRRRHVAAPSFADLLRAALRTLGGLAALYDAPLPADFAGLKRAAETVPTLHADFRDFHQRQWSNRRGDARPLWGVVGAAVYGPLPAELARWLAWGGRLHVGTDRVAGAGGWRVRALG